MNWPSWLETSTSLPGSGSPSVRSIEVTKTQGCRAKNGRARRALMMTRGRLAMGNVPRSAQAPQEAEHRLVAGARILQGGEVSGLGDDDELRVGQCGGHLPGLLGRGDR